MPSVESLLQLLITGLVLWNVIDIKRLQNKVRELESK